MRPAGVPDAGGGQALEQLGLEETGQLNQQSADIQALR
jgi:hypothetical protein